MNNENNNKPAPLFFDGFYSDDVPETAPEYILGKGTIAIDKMIAFLNAQRHIAINGGIKYTIKMAKTGKRYVEVDFYGMEKYKQWMEKNGKPQAQAPEPQAQVAQEYTLADVYPDEPPMNFDTIQ